MTSFWHCQSLLGLTRGGVVQAIANQKIQMSIAWLLPRVMGPERISYSKLSHQTKKLLLDRSNDNVRNVRPFDVRLSRRWKGRSQQNDTQENEKMREGPCAWGDNYAQRGSVRCKLLQNMFRYQLRPNGSRARLSA
jgi:hypothetical protein